MENECKVKITADGFFVEAKSEAAAEAAAEAVLDGLLSIFGEENYLLALDALDKAINERRARRCKTPEGGSCDPDPEMRLRSWRPNAGGR